ncbi:hypothetical protein Hanom_Chr07g00655031 [Helianthus anomalus]
MKLKLKIAEMWCVFRTRGSGLVLGKRRRNRGGWLFARGMCCYSNAYSRR